MRVILVRHGETEDNKGDAITGQMDISLNQTGIDQAKKTAERLENYDLNGAYSSDLERAYETARIIADKHDIETRQHEEFRERDFGKYEGEPKSAWRKVIDQHDRGRADLSPENGETLEEVGQRFTGKLDELRQNHDAGDRILVASHSAAIKACIMSFLGLKGDDYEKLDQSNTGITELEYTEFGWVILRMNDAAHLE